MQKVLWLFFGLTAIHLVLAFVELRIWFVSPSTISSLDGQSQLGLAFTPLVIQKQDDESSAQYDEVPVISGIASKNNTSKSTRVGTPIRDVICKGCRLAKINPRGPTCANVMRQKMKSSNRSLSQAGTEIAKQYPKVCQRCHPDACPSQDKLYWRIDQVGPNVRFGRTHVARLPQQGFRLPERLAENGGNNADFEVFLSDPENIIPQQYYMFEYNPVIVPLPKDQVPNSLSRDRPYYLGMLRLASVNQCLTDDHRQRMDPENKVYPGNELIAFIILDTNLNIIKQAIMYHLNHIDHRLFLLNGQLYLGFMHQITPIWINPPSSLPPPGHVYRKLTSNTPRIRDSEFSITIRSQPYSCCTSPLCRGKNFNYFTIGDGDDEQVYVEVKPVDLRAVEKINLNEACTRPQRQSLLNIEEEITLGREYADKPVTNETSLFVTSHVPEESYATTDEVYFPDHGIYQLPYTSERGSACCVRIPDPRPAANTTYHSISEDKDEKDRYLLVGVMHSKLPAWQHLMDLRKKEGADFGARQYASRWYAFEPRPPFRLVAQSGKFCLGFPSDSTEMAENSNNQYLTNHHYHLNHTDFDCPLIEFVTSMTEALDDPNQIILGYGLNDCVARMIKIDKSEITRMLFSPTSAPP